LIAYLDSACKVTFQHNKPFVGQILLTSDIIRVIIKEVGAERAQDKRYAYKALVGIRESETPLESHRHT
jgi:hypothetical protein